MTIDSNTPDPSSSADSITSVWSDFGHSFISEDDCESCLICGATYQLIADDPADSSHGRYCAANGDDPMPCTGDTGMAHGYPGERHDGNTDHDCNCIRCA